MSERYHHILGVVVHICINECLGERRSSGIKHIHDVPNQQNGNSLPQLSHNLLLLLPCLPADLPPELGDHLQRVLVPPTKSVHKKRNEHNTLCLTLVPALSHLDDKRVWDSTTSILQLFEQVLELIRYDKLQKRFLQFATKTDGLLQPFSSITMLSKRTICTMHVRND